MEDRLIEYKRGDKRPFKIIAILTGKVVGSSLTKKDAEASIRARYWGESRK